MYSLYYQGVRAKMWCTLCLSIVSIFFLEALLTFSTFYFTERHFEVSGLMYTAIGFLIPSAFLLLYKNTAVKAQESKGLRKELMKLKGNPKIFEALMAEQKQLVPLSIDCPTITIGEENARNVITFFSNPLCTPCSKLFLSIHYLIKHNSDVKCQLIFMVNNDSMNVGYRFIEGLFAISPSRIEQAIYDWSIENNKNFEVWKRKYFSTQKEVSVERIINEYNKAVNVNQIKESPTTYLNGRFLPLGFKLEDILK
jgi:hypothetical protein